MPKPKKKKNKHKDNITEVIKMKLKHTTNSVLPKQTASDTRHGHTYRLERDGETPPIYMRINLGAAAVGPGYGVSFVDISTGHVQFFATDQAVVEVVSLNPVTVYDRTVNDTI